MKTVRERMIALMAVVFGLEPEQIPANAAPGNPKQWDSLGHVHLITAAEEEFGVRFSDDEVTDLLSLDLYVNILEKKVQG